MPEQEFRWIDQMSQDLTNIRAEETKISSLSVGLILKTQDYSVA